MKTLQFILVLIGLNTLFLVNDVQAVNIPDEVVTAFKQGNAKVLAKYFNANIELVVLDKEDIYSKTQAEVIVRDFFSQNPVSDFSIVHQGGKEGAKYVIGNLSTSKGNFRVYIYMKTVGGNAVISQLRIEKE